MTWKVTSYANGDCHVTPMFDEKQHDTEGTCWCCPQLFEGAWIHNAADGRKPLELRKRAAA
jgi:hypothetical protein